MVLIFNRHDVEEKWNERAEGHKSETEALTKQIMEAEGLLEQLRMSYATMYEATRKDLKSLTADREHSHMMGGVQKADVYRDFESFRG